MTLPRKRRIAGPTGVVVAALFLTTLLVGTPPAHAKVGVRLGIPPPGQAWVEVVRVKLTGAARRNASRRAPLRFPKARSLPPSVKVLYARRTTRRKRSVTYGVLAIVVNRATAQARAAQNGTATDPWLEYLKAHPGPGPGVRVFTNEVDFLIFLGTQGNDVDIEDDAFASASAQLGTGVSATVVAANATKTPPAGAKKIGDAIDDLFSGVAGSDNSNAFETPSGKLDPNIDTGHYDDGHSFGWGIKTRAVEREADLDALKYLGNGNPGAVLPTLETFGKVDLNGNGTIEKPGQAGQTIDTTVGAPQISGGGF